MRAALQAAMEKGIFQGRWKTANGGSLSSKSAEWSSDAQGNNIGFIT
jgi:hypothetical protein